MQSEPVSFEHMQPDFSDVRLPNPLDLSVFRKLFFLHNGKVQIDQAA